MLLRAIGVIRSAVTDRKRMPPQGAPAAVELFAEFAEGLLHIGKHSHVWVLAWLDRAERDVLRVTPRGVSDRGQDGLHGVFAVRSPARPNPIGLTAARLLGVNGVTLSLDRLDFLDATPVIDVKPYFVTRDPIFCANNAPIGRPLGREALRESLLAQARNYHGEECADLLLAVGVIEHFRATCLDLAEPAQWRLTVPLSRPCLVDAVVGLTRATPGRGNLTFGSGEQIMIEWQGRSYTYPLGGGAPQDIG